MTFSGNASLGVDCLQVMQTVVSINQSAVKALSSSLKYSIFPFQQFSQMVDSSSNISPYGLVTQVSLELSWQLLRYNIFLTTFPLQRILGLDDEKIKGFMKRDFALDAGIFFFNICQILASHFFVTYKVPFCSLFLSDFYLNIKQNFRCKLLQKCSFPLISVSFHTRIYSLSHCNHDTNDHKDIKVNVILSWGISEWAS